MVLLHYFILVTEGLLSTAILAGLLYARIGVSYGKTGRRILHIGALAGLLAAVVMSVLKNTTSLVHTGIWSVRIFSVSLAAAVLMGVFAIPALQKRLGKIGAYLVSGFGALLLGTLLFYALPDIYAYPFNFSLGGASVFSSAFFTRFAGWLFGIVFAIVAGIAVDRLGTRAGGGLLTGVLASALFVNALSQGATILQVLYTRRYIKGSWIFQIIRWTSNNSNWFFFGVMACVLLLPIVMLVRSANVREPFENPAQHRKIRAKWRNVRRWSATILVCVALGTATLTAIKAYDERPVELSPVEESVLMGDNVYVPLEQVEDGHLHRFAYTTPDNITVRFIVIKKPNSSAYGVGLDACDICGETGYFERNGQIVCKLCDVVMNINTIGFKGGCNPIVIDYSVENGYIIVPTATLIEHQSEFK